MALKETDLKNGDLVRQHRFLQSGTLRQQQAYAILTRHQILSKLHNFAPILVGTIPINIDIESSDLNIICCFKNKEVFKKVIMDHFSHEKNFKLRELSMDATATVATFIADDFEIEIFGQTIPTKQQLPTAI